MKKHLWWMIGIVVTALVFRNYFLFGQVPIPADILLGGYYPFLEQKWGEVVAVGVRNNVPADVFSLLYPWRYVGIEMLKSGTIPLWDSSILFGVPLLANFQAAILTPVNILYYFLSHLDAWTWQIILQPVVAWTGMYFLSRSLKVSKFASIFSGISFAFCGYMTVWMEYNSINYAAGLIPWILLWLNLLRHKQKGKYVLGLAISIALQLISGYPLLSIYTLAVIGIFWLFNFPNRNRVLATATVIVSLAAGFNFAAVQLIPGAEAEALSIRIFDNVAVAGQVKYLPINHWITFFVPDYFGHPVTANYFAVGSYENFAFSLSAVTVVFLVCAVFTKRTWEKKYIWLWFLIVLCGLFATQNKLTNWLDGITWMGLNSAVNTRVMIFSSLAGSILSGIALQVIIENKKILKLIISSLPFIAIVVWTYLEYRNGLINGLVSFRNSVLPVGFAVLTVVWSIVTRKGLAKMGILILLIFSVVFGTDKYLTFLPKYQVFPNMDLMNELKQLDQRINFEKAPLFPANSWSVYGVKSPVGQNAVTPLDTARYLQLVETGENNDKVLTRYNQISDVGLRSELYNALGAKYFLALNRNKFAVVDPNGEPFGWLMPEWYRKIKDVGTVGIYENTKNRGLAWFGSNSYCANTKSEIIEHLTDKTYSLDNSWILGCSGQFEGKGRIVDVYVSPLKNVWQTENNKENFLIVSLSHYPGWQAKIDGRVVNILQGNLAFMAIKIPSGKHTVELAYWPRSVIVGMAISGSMILVWIFYGWLMLGRKTR